MSRFRVDLRSDTVTTPSAAMRRAMADAEVGDDWYGDDPTVNAAAGPAAERHRHGGGPVRRHGTMANQIAHPLHVAAPGTWSCLRAGQPRRDDRGDDLGGALGDRLQGHRPDGAMLTAESVAAALEPDDYFDVEVVDLLAIENTRRRGTAGPCSRSRTASGPKGRRRRRRPGPPRRRADLQRGRGDGVPVADCDLARWTR